MRRHRRRIRLRLDTHEFYIRAIRKAGERHLSGMIRMLAAIFGRETRRRRERLPHRLELRARHCHVVDLQLRRAD